MKRVLPLAAIAGALAAVVAVGSAQAAPASGNVLGKLTTIGENGTAVEKAGYRHRHRWHHHRKWWKKRYYRRHHNHGYRHHYRRHRRWH